MSPVRRPDDPELWPTLPGFEHVNRYWDPQHSYRAAKILPGEYYVTIRDELIVTVLGSCVAACIRDRRTGVGGMNHFMLPETNDHVSRLTLAERYGVHAMESLINGLLRAGAARERLVVKLFGGGRVLDAMTDIGRMNADFALDYVQREGIEVQAEDLGGDHPRKVHFYPATGRCQVRLLKILRNDTVAQRESAYRADLKAAPLSGSVELF